MDLYSNLAIFQIKMPRKEQQDFWLDESIKDVAFEDCYTIDKELGRGATAVVHKCEHKGTFKPWAVKIITKKVEQKVIRTEIGILLKLSHENIIRLHEVYETPTHIYLVLELVRGGELFDRITTRGSYSEKDAAKAIRDILLGLKHIHESDIVHRDLKVTDFGLSKIIEKDVHMATVCGTPGYCAPEILCGTSYTKAVDLWSIGVITYILLCGYEPFYEENDRLLFKKILKGEYFFYEEDWKNVSENAKDLIKKLLVLDPKHRLTVDQALEHPWVKGCAAKSDHMAEAHNKIKDFNAKRKMKALTEAALIAVRAVRQSEVIGSILAFSDGSMHTSNEVQPMEVN
ncbi:hypothetical protein KUTeg_018132 [Tegillarca granosa]|uniref:Protein kinase domain-containing protein n=1 Tax=Tegillarca granosa TaxID=220873 RepID=A0ABQ9EGX0_TEGGR|nr:hypothetical protein KUTeg_018132 [Tegillarca granosa]